MANSLDEIIQNEIKKSQEPTESNKKDSKSGLYYISKILIASGVVLCFIALVFITMMLKDEEKEEDLIYMAICLGSAGSAFFYGFIGLSVDRIRINTEK